jgi:hypothetical protein
MRWLGMSRLRAVFGQKAAMLIFIQKGGLAAPPSSHPLPSFRSHLPIQLIHFMQISFGWGLGNNSKKRMDECALYINERGRKLTSPKGEVIFGQTNIQMAALNVLIPLPVPGGREVFFILKFSKGRENHQKLEAKK